MEHGLFRGAGIVNHHRHTLMFYPELCPPKRASSANSSRLPSNGLNFLQAGEPKKANKEYDELYRLKGQLRQFPDRGEAALKRISTTDDPDVQSWRQPRFWRSMNHSQPYFSNEYGTLRQASPH